MTFADAELDRAIEVREEELRKLKRRRRAIRSGKAGGRPKQDPERDAKILAAYRSWEGPTRYGAVRAIALHFNTNERHVSRVTQALRQGSGAQTSLDKAPRTGTMRPQGNTHDALSNVPADGLSRSADPSCARAPAERQIGDRPVGRLKRQRKPASIQDKRQTSLF